MASWVKVKPGEMPPHPVVGGSAHLGEAFYVARGIVTGKGIIPGNIRATWEEAHVSYGGEQQSAPDYEILNNPDYKVGMRWVASGTRGPPEGAIVGGNEEDGTPLYVGRALFSDGHYVPGKINFKHGQHGACYIPFDDKEHNFTDFYVLCQ